MTRPGAPLESLFGRAVSQVVATGSLDVEADGKILDAGRAVLERRGTKAATMDDVAAEAGVSRATLFRRFSSKDQLFERVLAREFSHFLSALAERFKTVTDPTEQIIEAVSSLVRLRGQLFAGSADPAQPTDLIRALGQGEPSPLALGHFAVRSNIAKAQADGKLPTGDPDLQADALIHLTIGYLTSPSLAVDLEDPAALRRLVEIAFAPILTAPGNA